MRYLGIMTLSLLSLQVVASQSVGSQSVTEKVTSAYSRQQGTGQVHCEHSGVKYLSNKFILNQTIITEFSLDSKPFSISINKDGRKFKAQLSGDDGHLSLAGSVDNGDKSISFYFKNLSSREQNLVKKHKLQDMRCMVEVYKDMPVELTNEKVHINMHPHSEYDHLGVTTKAVEGYLEDSSIQSIVLIDNFDLSRGIKLKNFMPNAGYNYRLGDFSTPTVSIPESVKVYSSSAGHNLFKIGTQNLEVIYTGGNLNYCILNNTRRLMDTFLQYSDGGVLDIHFDLDGIVAQKGSWLKNASFVGGKYNGYYVKEEFRNNPENANRFHKAFKHFFENDQLSNWQKQKLYSKLVYTYTHEGKVYSNILKGSGEGQYSIKIKFLNE